MTRFLTPLLCLLLAGCAGAVRYGPDPNAGMGVRAVVHVEGSWDAQALADQIPLTVLFKGSGSATLTARPLPPFLTIDGSADVLIEPAAGHEQAAQAAVSRGDVVIRRAGVVGLLNAPGSIPVAAFPKPVSLASPYCECVGDSCFVPTPLEEVIPCSVR